jgi:hypothetical protein
MPIIPQAEKMGNFSTRYFWSGDAPFRVWVNGELRLDLTEDTELIVQYPGEATPHAIEVLDSNDTEPAESQAYSPRLWFQWRGQADAFAYLVQRLEGEEWVTKTPVKETRQGYYWYKTMPETDGTTAEWRVITQDALGYTSEVVRHTEHVVCNPLPPRTQGTYDSGTGDLTVEAAA